MTIHTPTPLPGRHAELRLNVHQREGLLLSCVPLLLLLLLFVWLVWSVLVVVVVVVVVVVAFYGYNNYEYGYDHHWQSH